MLDIRIVLTILLTLMIISTVIGNILVCLSVILVRKLRHPSNYLLVSQFLSSLFFFFIISFSFSLKLVVLCASCTKTTQSLLMLLTTFQSKSTSLELV